MKHHKIKIIIVFVFSVILIVSYFYFTKSTVTPEFVAIKNEQVNPDIIPTQAQEEWKTFTNTAYHYSIMYPNIPEGPRFESDGPPSEEAFDVSFGVPSTLTNLASGLTIEAKEILPKYIYPNNEYPNAEPVLQKIIARQKEIAALSLKKYVDLIYQYQIAEQTLNSPYSAYTIKVGPLTESTFANQRSYQFTLTGGYHDEFASYGIGNEESMYIITEDPRGNKFIIHYTNNNNAIAEKMLASFRFLDTSTSTANIKLQ